MRVFARWREDGHSGNRPQEAHALQLSVPQERQTSEGDTRGSCPPNPVRFYFCGVLATWASLQSGASKPAGLSNINHVMLLK